MSAGNQVAIRRDFTLADGSTSHSKLDVTWDDRISTGALEMPGLPPWLGGDGSNFSVAVWHEVASH